MSFAHTDAYGIAFLDTSSGLGTLVGTPEGVEILTAKAAFDNQTVIEVPECPGMRDIKVVSTTDIVAVCAENHTLVRLKVFTGLVSDSFACCTGLGESFEPYAVTLLPDGQSVLAGGTDVYRIDVNSGTVLEMVIPPGVEGATWYHDFLFTPGDRLLVSAAPSIGVLEFDAATFEFLRILIPPDPADGIEDPGGMALKTDQTFVVAASRGYPVREFDLETGSLVRQWIAEGDEDTKNTKFHFVAVRP